MEQEILLEDGLGGEHKVKYLDENRVTVQTVTTYANDVISYSMPAKYRRPDTKNTYDTLCQLR